MLIIINIILEIILVTLLPNTTRLTQPADVGIFRSIKSAWKNSIQDYRSKSDMAYPEMRHFAPLLKSVLADDRSEQIKSAFRHSGLFPWNPSAVNYDSLLTVPTSGETSSSSSMDVGTFKTLVGEEVIDGLLNGCSPSGKLILYK